VFAYGVCIGTSGKYERLLSPSLRRTATGPVLERRGQRSIFVGYQSIIEEVRARYPGAEGLVLVHEDVEIRSNTFEDDLRAVLRAPDIGAVGVVGGLGPGEMFWWKRATLHGHVEHMTHADDFSRGVHDVDVLDGLLMVLTPAAISLMSLSPGRYPGFHGYDAELCSLVRNAQMRVITADLDVFHDCKRTDWTSPELFQAQSSGSSDGAGEVVASAGGGASNAICLICRPDCADAER
jgi:hypothetical protein